MKLPNAFFNHDAQAGGFYPRSHFGIDISSLGQKQNTLIEGIRGTGKTHVLKMISRYYVDNFEDLRVLPIYVSLAQISEHAKKEAEEFRLHLYAHIVQRCVETAEINRSHLHPDKGLLEKAIRYIAALFGLKTEPDIAQLLASLRRTAELLLFKLQFDLTSKNFREKTNESQSASGSVNSSADISAASLKAHVQSTSAKTVSFAAEAEANVMYVGRQLVHKDAASFLLEFLKQIQVLLDLEYSLLLLDECSEASPQSQTEIFRLFKTIRGGGSQLPGKDNCAFFIGTVYPRGETYYPTRDMDSFSFDPGQDCTMEFLQWDEGDLESYISFFKGMTINRAREVLGYAADFGMLMNDLFDREETFLLAAFCAHGIPRRYWEILKRSYDHNVGKILHKSVAFVVHEIANDQILRHESIDEDTMQILQHVIRDLSRQNSSIRQRSNAVPQNIYFILPRGYAPEKISKLIMQGAIHDKSRMRTSKQTGKPELTYAIDMAIAYTYRIIPPPRFVSILSEDIPRCWINYLQQAFRLAVPYVRSTAKKPAHQAQLDEVRADSAIDGESRLTGTIQSYKKGKSGVIALDDGNLDCFFTPSDLRAGDRNTLKAGDRVRFVIKVAKDGSRLARRITVIQPLKQIEGVVKTYEPGGFGFIEVLDGGPDASFLAKHVPKSLVDELKAGDRVLCDIIQTVKGRQAINLSLQTVPVQTATRNLDEITGYILNYVHESSEAVQMGTLASQLRSHFGDSVSNTQWFGYGTFKKLLLKLNMPNVSLSFTAPGHVYDAARHKVPK